MASMTESTSSNQATVDGLLDTFEALGQKHDHCMRHRVEELMIRGDEKAELTEEEVDQRHERLDELRSKLLPSLKDHLNRFSAALHLADINSSSEPDFESASQSIQQLDQILIQAVQLNDSLNKQTPIPSNEYDYHLKETKIYRTKYLMSKTTALWRKRDLLFYAGVTFVKSWKTSDHNCLTRTYDDMTPRENLLHMATQYHASVDKIIRLSQVSELTMLQEHWQDTHKQLTKTLTLLGLLHTDKRNPRVISREVDELVQATKAVTKLLRTLYKKISTNQLELSLNTEEINSKTSSLLHSDLITIEMLSRHIVNTLGQIIRRNSMSLSIKDSMLKGIPDLFEIIDYNLLLLALYLVPQSSSKIRCSLRHCSDFKAWLFMWQRHWNLAKTHLSNAVSVIPMTYQLANRN